MSTGGGALGWRPDGLSATARWVAVLCWIAILIEGFDVVVIGTVMPALLDYQPWGLSPEWAGLLASLALVGMMIGSLTVGTVTDIIGRRKSIILSVTWFSAFTALCAAAPTPELFGMFRFLSGLGLGGLLPMAATMVSEYGRAGRGGSSITFMMTGFHVGAVLTALVALPVLPALGWRAMFVAGVLPALVIVPLMLRHMPESPSFLLAEGRREEAEALGERHSIALEEQGVGNGEDESGRFDSLKTLVAPGYLLGTLAFFVASFMGLLLVYGLNSGLPEIMNAAGYALDASLVSLLVLNLGAIAGLFVSGPVSDRYGSKTACAGWFALSAVFLFLLSIRLPLTATYLLVFATGFWVFSSQVLVYAFVSKHYPAGSRGTALGWVAGIGRLGSIAGPLMGGALVGAGLGIPWGFYAFSLVGLAGGIAVSLVPVVRRGTGRREARLRLETAEE